MPIKKPIKVTASGQPIYAKRVSFKPLKTFSDSIQFNGNGDHLALSIGGTKLKYDSDPVKEELSRPLDTPRDFDWNSVYGIYLQGKENVRQRY